MEGRNGVMVALAVVGFLNVVRLVGQAAWWVWCTFLRSGKKPLKYGSWAVVTGATDGIGRAMAVRLAKSKVNVVVVGRTATKLEELKTELESNYSVKVHSALVDFTDENWSAGLERIGKEVAGLDVGILVNNVGMSYPYARFFHEVDSELLKNLVRINIEVTTQMIQLVLPGMLERKRGAIINVGSGSATILPSDPLYSVYAATKAYVDQLSRCLHVEYKQSGIDVHCQVPLYVATKMSKIRRASLFVPSPDRYARDALQHLGHEPRCTPYWVHSVMWWVISILPEFVIDSIRLRMSMDVRRRGKAKGGKKDE